MKISTTSSSLKRKNIFVKFKFISVSCLKVHNGVNNNCQCRQLGDNALLLLTMPLIPGNNILSTGSGLITQGKIKIY